MTGKMMANDDPVVRLQEFCPCDLDAGLVERALACRRAATDPDALFPARTLLPSQVAALDRLVHTVADWP